MKTALITGITGEDGSYLYARRTLAPVHSKLNLGNYLYD